MAVEDTALLVYGTGGLRSLSKDNRTLYLDAVSDLVTENYSFKLRNGWLGVLTGQEEGMVDWIAIQQFQAIAKQENISFVKGEFDNEHRTIGILDMGGATTEIAFIPSQLQDPVDPKRFKTTKGSQLYSVSFKSSGVNDAFSVEHEALINYYYERGDHSNRYDNPCIPRGAYIRSAVLSPTGKKVHFDGS